EALPLALPANGERGPRPLVTIFRTGGAVEMLYRLISSFRPRLDHLFIACMPKSGSTYLHTVLREITGFRDAYVSEWGEQNEGDICERRLRRLRRRSVLQQHVKATQ